MSEQFSTQPEHTQDLNRYEAYVGDGLAIVASAARILNGEHGAPESYEALTTLLTEPYGKGETARADSATPELSSGQETELREVAALLGIGAHEDTQSYAEEDFPAGYIVFNEGGLAWKQDAQAALSHAGAVALVHAGDPTRLVRDDERAHMATIWGLTEEESVAVQTEYDIARRVAERQPGFTPEEDQVLPYGYELTQGNPVVREATGQFVRIGTQDGKPVVLLRVDREAADGSKEFRPRTENFLGILTQVLAPDSPSVGAVVTTSNSYASRVPNTINAGLREGKHFGAKLYGRDMLARIKGEEATPAPLNQIPGELGTYLRSLLRLRDTVQQQSSL